MPWVQIYEIVYAPLAKKRNASIMDGVFGDDIQDSREFLRGASERGYVVEQVIHLHILRRRIAYESHKLVLRTTTGPPHENQK